MNKNFWGGFEKKAFIKRLLRPFREFGEQGKYVADRGHAAAEKILEASKNNKSVANTVKEMANDVKSLKGKKLILPALAASAVLGFGGHVGKRVASIGERDGHR